MLLDDGARLRGVDHQRDEDVDFAREAPRDSAFMACGLYYEHDWTADGAISRSRRAQFERDELASLNRYVDKLQADGLTRTNFNTNFLTAADSSDPVSVGIWGAFK